MRGPTRKEDGRNLTLIVGSAFAGLLLTAAVIATTAPRHGPYQPPPVEPGLAAHFASGAPTGDHLHGTVVTRSGDTFRGFIRWDRNEGSWTDLLDATKRSPSNQSGIRFGHVRRIEPTGSRSARLLLKNGKEVQFDARATDLGSGLRALVVDDPAAGSVELRWQDLGSVEFEPVPASAVERQGRRLYGTLVTTSGLEFTGHVTWDVDEIHTTDVLDGEDHRGVDREIPFGRIASIARNDSRSARVVLQGGETLILHGSNDVDRSNRGIAVSDPTLGQVSVRWDHLVEVRLGEGPGGAGYETFDGGRPLRGVVTTRTGAELRGTIRWDDDEAFTWEILNGSDRGVEFHVELGNVASIERGDRSGATVELRDGRRFALDGSNDVDSGNRGISIFDGQIHHEVDWRDFESVRFESR